MSLISLKTNLKSLRYGKDRPGGGSSNQPYIKSPLPGDPSATVVNPNNLNFLDKVLGTGKNLINFAGTDFFLRGGSSAVSRAAKDVSRLTQMFTDFKSPNGVLFAVKQNVLSLTGVKTQASGIINEGIYTPASTILQAGGNAFGVHLNKQGLNPFQSTAPDDKPGFLGIQSPLRLPVYAQIVRSNQESVDNRLVQLKNAKLNSSFVNPTIAMFQAENAIGEVRAQTQRARAIARANDTMGQFRKERRKSRQSARADEKIQNKLNISKNSDEILKYGGGPNSILGIGQTTIRRYSNTEEGLDFDKNPNFKGRYFVLSSAQINGIGASNLNTSVLDFRNEIFNNLEDQDPSYLNPQIPTAQKRNILSLSPDYSVDENRIESRFNLGDPGRRNKNLISYTSGSLDQDGKPIGPLDKITYHPIYKSLEVKSDDILNDLVKFRIGIISNEIPSSKVYIHFRAFLDSMDDQYTAEWNSFKYVGRGENFYRYGGFSRTINLSWTVAAQSKQELIPIYQKLNFLASSLAPDYSTNGYMRGNLATLTIGGYLHEQPGIITSLNYSVPQESPWEIGINNLSVLSADGSNGVDSKIRQLPHMIKVTGFQFIPIHNFVPRIQQNTFNDKGENTKFGPERYIALKNDKSETLYGQT
jgi:hypothetical protein